MLKAKVVQLYCSEGAGASQEDASDLDEQDKESAMVWSDRHTSDDSQRPIVPGR